MYLKKKSYQFSKLFNYEHSFLQPGLKEFSFNPLRDKQIDHSCVYFKKSHDSLKMSCD